MDVDLHDLTSPNWQTRRAAVERLLNQADPRTLDRLLRVIKERQDDLGLLNAALQVLQRNALPVIASLAELLQDEDVDTRIYAAQALGQINHAAAVPLLLDALTDPAPNVRYHAIDSLGHLRAVQAVPALREYLQMPDFFLTFPAIEALARIGDPSVVPDLLPLLEDPLLASAAVEALGALASPREIPAILLWMCAPEADILLACGALTRLWERHRSPPEWVPRQVRSHLPAAARQRLLQTVAQSSPARLRDAVAVLGWLEGRDVQEALLLLLRHRETRPAAASALARMGGGALSALLEALPAADGEERLALVRLLGTLGDERAAPALIALLSAGDAAVVTEAAQALGRIGARPALDALLAQLRHPSGLVRRAVVAAINSLGHPEHTRRLLPLTTDPDPRVRAAVIASLGYFASPEAEEAILQALEDEAGMVQRAAVRALGVLDTPRARAALERAASAPNPQVRAAAMQAVGLSETGRPLLHRGLEDPVPWVRLYACRALALLPAEEESIRRLLPLAHADPAPHVRLTAIEALGMLDGAQAERALRALLNDPAPEVGEAAIQALAALPGGLDIAPLRERIAAAPPPLRLRFVARLSEADTSGSARLLALLAAEDAEFEVRHAALQALTRLASPAAAERLVSLLENSPDEIQALNACLEHGLACLPPLLQRLPQGGVELRRRAVRALQVWAVQSAEAQNALLELSRDADAGVRAAAASGLSLLPQSAGLRRLRQMASSDPHPEVRAAASHAIKRLGT